MHLNITDVCKEIETSIWIDDQETDKDIHTHKAYLYIHMCVSLKCNAIQLDLIPYVVRNRFKAYI